MALESCLKTDSFLLCSFYMYLVLRKKISQGWLLHSWKTRRGYKLSMSQVFYRILCSTNLHVHPLETQISNIRFLKTDFHFKWWYVFHRKLKTLAYLQYDFKNINTILLFIFLGIFREKTWTASAHYYFSTRKGSLQITKKAAVGRFPGRADATNNGFVFISSVSSLGHCHAEVNKNLLLRVTYI